jgi:tRNA(fMet)-specific endonuclease VapC
MILDTNALSALADGDEALFARLDAVPELYVPVVVLGEYRFGIEQSRYRRTYERWLDDALGDLAVLPILEPTARQYAKLFRELKAAGTPIPTNDVWIAALCREHRLPLVSRDSHFAAVSALRRVVW